jgi:RNA polymerase sigma-70 factor (ECF subfamily)
LSPATDDSLHLVRAPRAEVSDDALMSLASADDARAFAVLVTRHQAAVRRLCEVILRDSAQARDVAQQTFLRLWEHRRRYRPEGHFTELLFTIARNESRRVARRTRILSFFGLAPAPQHVPSTAGAPDPVEQVQTWTLIAAAIQRLPEHFRVALTLRFADGLSHEQIATVIGRTPSAARSRVHHGLKALTQLLPKDFYP